MNQAEIKTQYPKSWSLLEAWYNERQKKWKGYVDGNEFISPELMYDRLLYDFFDEHNIVVEIQLDPDNELFDAYTNQKLKSQAGTMTWFDDTVGEGYETREEAEIAAFNKAFEILEGRL